ncbi:universal stress protein [Sabulilitoribacter arenilitoris]|uniref:Universal stress protein n=1 Tax=Wocania arenilitoris TaxID=2044858 RepID=A0AAE3EQ82_9FLAO|nr:universal stress protein [Wocania arenilitoris]MCF7568139.1 universal stress protein [Wocania arenilitoris]
MQTILLPTDLSKNSINAIDYAVELFKDVECCFYVLNVQKASSFISDDMMVVSSSATIYKTLIDAAKISISNIISNIEKKHHNKKHQFYSVVDYDNFIDAISQVCKKHKVNLIVMGTKGASGLDKVIFGSNTVRVIQRCETPVLAIPDGCEFAPINRIAFSTNHETLFEKEKLLLLKDLMRLYNSNLTIIHIADEHHLSQKQERNNDFFNTNFPDAIHEYIDVNTKEMFSVIKQYLSNNNIEMLSMMSEKHSFLERLFTKHAVETFALGINVPFLVIERSRPLLD